MSNIDKRALREAAEKAQVSRATLVTAGMDIFDGKADIRADMREGVIILEYFRDLASPATVLALLDELEAAEERVTELSQKADIYDMLRQDYGLQGSLVDFVDWQSKRIAELEAIAKSVKFDPIPMEDLGNKSDGKKHPYMFGAGYNSAVVHCESVLLQAFAAAAGKGEAS